MTFIATTNSIMAIMVNKADDKTIKPSCFLEDLLNPQSSFPNVVFFLIKKEINNPKKQQVPVTKAVTAPVILPRTNTITDIAAIQNAMKMRIKSELLSDSFFIKLVFNHQTYTCYELHTQILNAVNPKPTIKPAPKVTSPAAVVQIPPTTPMLIPHNQGLLPPVPCCLSSLKYVEL